MVTRLTVVTLHQCYCLANVGQIQLKTFQLCAKMSMRLALFRYLRPG
jgi:hypothetical protein